MDSRLALTERTLNDCLPFAFLALFASMIVVPAIVFGLARRVAREQPQFAGAALGGAVAIALGAIAAATLILLVLLGWLPPPGSLAGPPG